MSKIRKGRKMREFSVRREKGLGRNYLKYYKLASRDVCQRYELTPNELQIMLFIYDYEFFTGKHLASVLLQGHTKLMRQVIYPLQQRGWIDKAISRGTVGKITMEQARFEQKGNYRARYKLAQRGRLAVQHFYRKLEGEETISFTPRI